MFHFCLIDRLYGRIPRDIVIDLVQQYIAPYDEAARKKAAELAKRIAHTAKVCSARAGKAAVTGAVEGAAAGAVAGGIVGTEVGTAAGAVAGHVVGAYWGAGTGAVTAGTISAAKCVIGL